MTFGRITELELQLEHRHSDGSWGRFQRAHHDPADHDPERAWSKGVIYQCTTCDEQVRVKLPTDPSGLEAPA